MAEPPAIAPELVTALVPSLSRSLAEQFNVFRVMHHGTHEKQLSNVFAWLLDPAGTHELGDAPQGLFLDLVNAALPADVRLPRTGYEIAQEVVTPGHEGNPDPESADISDMLLSSPEAAVVVENFGTSDGHGHDYYRYLALGTAGGRVAVVVLLCERHVPHLQHRGWQNAVVVTYAEFLSALRTRVARDQKWLQLHPAQHVFLRQLFEHFVEGPAVMNTDDTLAFLTAMCETGESARYGYQPRGRVAQEFGEQIAAQAQRQLEESRALLASTKRRLHEFVKSTLVAQVREEFAEGSPVEVNVRFQGQWEWCIELRRGVDHPSVFLVFGPTAVAVQERVPRKLEQPDYSQVFATLQDKSTGGNSRIAHTGVDLREALEGLDSDDIRLRDSVLGILTEG